MVPVAPAPAPPPQPPPPAPDPAQPGTPAAAAPTVVPQAPAEAPSLPEVKREGRELWERLVELRGKRIRGETREKLMGLLGKEEVEKMSWYTPLDDQTITEIYSRLIEARVGMYPHIHQYVEKKKNISIYYRDPSGNTAPLPLNQLISDPQSKEGRTLAWLMEPIHNPTGKQSEIFNQISDNMASDAENLLKMQQIFNKIAQDSENQKLGGDLVIHPGNPDASTPVWPSVIAGDRYKAIGRLQWDEENALFRAALELKKKKKGNPGPYYDIASKHKVEIDRLRKKREELRRDLSKLHSYTKKVQNQPNTDVYNVDDLSNDFTQGGVLTPLTKQIFLGREEKTARDWLNDDALEKKGKQILERWSQIGRGLPTASVALNDFLKIHFEPRLLGMSDDDKKRLYKEMKEMLLSQEKPPVPSRESPQQATQPPEPSGEAAPAAQAAGHPETKGFRAWFRRQSPGTVLSIPVGAVTGATVASFALGTLSGQFFAGAVGAIAGPTLWKATKWGARGIWRWIKDLGTTSTFFGTPSKGVGGGGASEEHKAH